MSKEIIALTLKEQRKAAGLTAKESSTLLKSKFGIEVAEKTIYGYESGIRQPDIDTFLAMCVIYDIKDILAAFGYKQDKRNQFVSESQKVIEAYKQASTGRKESVRKLLDVELVVLEPR